MKLVVLQLDTNHFTGLLPQNLCQSGPLQNFTTNNNHLIGLIPSTLNNCIGLSRVRLEKNNSLENYLKILVSIETCITMI